MLSSIVSSLIEDGTVKSKESESYIIINTIAQSQFHTENKVGKIFLMQVLRHDDNVYMYNARFV